MQAIPFPEQNSTLNGGGDVSDLPVFRDGNQVISCWALTPEELSEIMTTGCVYLCVLSPTTHPPVKVTGEYPFQRVEN